MDASVAELAATVATRLVAPDLGVGGEGTHLSGHRGVPRMLFLVSDTGGGHRASAAAVADAVHSMSPSTYIQTLDPFDDAKTGVNPIVGLYGPILRHTRWLWGFVYHLFNTRAGMAFVLFLMRWALMGAITRAIDEHNPDTVVSFHPLMNHVLAALPESYRRDRRFVTVVTDWHDIHKAWICPDMDTVVVPSKIALAYARKRGLSSDRIVFASLPVHSRFRNVVADKATAKQALGLPSDKFCVLIVGGADGSGNIVARTAALVSSSVDVHVVTICGRNKRARAAVEKLREHYPDKLTPCGFVANMHEWMGAADLLVTKAGPGALAEALSCELPMILTWYAPGQERGNVVFAREGGFGLYAPRVRRLVPIVEELAKPGSRRYRKLREQAHAHRPIDASSAIARLLLDSAPVRSTSAK